MDQSTHIDKSTFRAGLILLVFLGLVIAAAHYTHMTRPKIMIMAICFCIADLYWAIVGLICILKRIGDYFRGVINSKTLLSESLSYCVLMVLPFFSYLIGIGIYNKFS